MKFNTCNNFTFILECIAVGCEPLASVAISGGGGVSQGVVDTETWKSQAPENAY